LISAVKIAWKECRGSRVNMSILWSRRRLTISAFGTADFLTGKIDDRICAGVENGRPRFGA
jgi:hypothetical protein